MYVLSIVLIVMSNVMYNISQKSTPGGVNPFASLLVTYSVAAVVTLTASFFVKNGKGLVESFSELNWTSFVLGCAIVGLELGYLFAYRSGWKISVVTLVANITLAMILICVGVFAFKESFEWYKFLGVGMCVAGLVLLNK